MFHIDLCYGIHCASWFIKNHNPWLADEDLCECHTVPFTFGELPRHPLKYLLALFLREPCHLECYECLSHRELFWEFQSNRIGKVVKDRPMGKKIIFLVQESDVTRCPSALLNTGFGHVDPFFTNPDIY